MLSLRVSLEHSNWNWYFWVKYVTRDQAKRSIVDYIEMFYNSKRLHSYLDYMAPMQFEKIWLLEKAA